jgi:hypothetical protein
MRPFRARERSVSAESGDFLDNAAAGFLVVTIESKL